MKQETTNDSLARAIDSLKAVEVAPAVPCAPIFGIHQETDPSDCAFYPRFAYYSPQTERWHIVGRAALLSLAAVRGQEDCDNWDAASAISMPAWWTPKRRFTWRGREAFDLVALAGLGVQVRITNVEWSSWQCERITADLTTGEEVPA